VKQNTQGFKHQAVTEKIIGVFFEIYNDLGHGFLESVYHTTFELALSATGLKVYRKIEIPVWWRGKKVGEFEADLLVNNCVLLELKACRCLDKAHEAQLLNYLRATDIEVGLLFNFGVKPEFRRLAFDNQRKRSGSGSSLLHHLLLQNDEGNRG
jgi:GxxExxY protein